MLPPPDGAVDGVTGAAPRKRPIIRAMKVRDAWPGKLRIDSTRIAVVADTHVDEDGWGSPPELLEALRGVELILHCGDLDVLGVLDHLETVAPVLAVRGYPDPREDGDRLAEEARVVEVDGVRIGMLHDPRWLGPEVRWTHTLEFPPGWSVDDLLERRFGQRVDVVCFGDTHDEFIGTYQGVLFVNPGSTTRPNTRHTRDDLGTFALLDVKRGVVSAEIRKLRRATGEQRA